MAVLLNPLVLRFGGTPRADDEAGYARTIYKLNSSEDDAEKHQRSTSASPFTRHSVADKAWAAAEALAVVAEAKARALAPTLNVI